LPASLRDLVTDHIRYSLGSPASIALHEAIVKILMPALERSGASHIVDTCSGGGGLMPAVMPMLRESLGRNLTMCLTDLYPNVPTLQQMAANSSGVITFSEKSVSAFDVPRALGTFQTLVTAFHHFKPEDARTVLRDACEKRRTIVVIEPFSRKDAVGVAFGSLLAGVVLTPWVGPLNWRRFLWTYPLPISAMVLAWDGVVSCLRAYSAGDMETLARDVSPTEYQWTAGYQPVPGGMGITYLVGEPVGA